MSKGRGKRLRCFKGKSCRWGCISRNKLCIVELSPGALKGVIRLRKAVAERKPKLFPSPIRPTPAKQEQKGGLTVSKESSKAAKELISRYQKSEPATTALMKDLAKRNNLELIGLQHRLKTETSLARKIEQEKDSFEGNARKAAESMSDVNRYTMQISPQNYRRSANDVLSTLREQGYSARIKNYWGSGGPYRGINVALTSPTGLKIELQLHTADSLKVKGKSHGLYEDFRVSKDNAKRRELWNQMVQLADTIPLPKGALKIGGTEAAKVVKFEMI